MRPVTLIVFLPFLILFACGDGKRAIRDYYFPVSELRAQSKVYEYAVTQNGAEDSEYWYYRAFLRDSGQFLAATYYDRRFQIGQILREKITDEGATVRDYFLYDVDPETGKQIQTQAVIESPDIFQFRARDSSGVIQFKLHYKPPESPENTLHIARKRMFMGDAPPFEFQGKSHPCIRFILSETVTEAPGGAVVLKGSGEEWYAEGLGLVYYRKVYGENDLKLEGRLKDIFPMAELERRAAEMYGEEEY